jgi:hypothetical protein
MYTSRQFSVEIFVGQATNMGARIYVGVRSDIAFEQVARPRRLTGSVSGPECRYARTLPIHVPLRETDSKSPLLAEALVPDPCFWTPQMPHLYQVQADIYDGHDKIGQCGAMFGIRRFTTRGCNLILDEKRFVIRGTASITPWAESIQRWHDAELAALVTDPNDELCAEASRCGVLLIAELTRIRQRLRARELSQWPAVGLVIQQRAVLERPGAEADIPNGVIAAQRFALGERVRPANRAQAVICDVEEAGEAAARIGDCPLPIVAFRRCRDGTSVDEARAACDRLQRDLAPRFDLAGYLV